MAWARYELVLVRYNVAGVVMAALCDYSELGRYMRYKMARRPWATVLEKKLVSINELRDIAETIVVHGNTASWLGVPAEEEIAVEEFVKRVHAT